MQKPAADERPAKAREERDALIEAELGGGGGADRGFRFRGGWRRGFREGLGGVQQGGDGLRGVIPLPGYVNDCACEEEREGDRERE